MDGTAPFPCRLVAEDVRSGGQPEYGFGGHLPEK